MSIDSARNQISLPTLWAVWLIRFYQRHISPHKGFRCAHRALHGGDSCSEAVLGIVQTWGIWRSGPMIRTRFQECRQASQQLKLKAEPLESTEEAEQETPAGQPNSNSQIPELCCGGPANHCVVGPCDASCADVGALSPDGCTVAGDACGAAPEACACSW